MNRMDLDTAVYDMECGINALCAIYTAMSSGEFPAEEHLDGLYFVYSHLFEAAKAIRREVDKNDKQPHRKGGA